MNTFRKNKGITLISLVVSIIVLLILSGISISMLSGNNGILKQVSNAKNMTEEATKNEQKDLAELEDVIYESQTGVAVEKVQDTNAGVLEISEADENVLTINSIEDLVFFAYDVTNGNTYEGKTVELGISLDFKSNKSYVDASRTDYAKYGYNGLLKTALTTGEGFKGIGTLDNNSQSSYSFVGTFDGKGKVINNLYMKVNLIDNSKDLRMGFFGNNYGTVKNLGVRNCNISGTLDTTGNNTAILGGIVGFNYGEINSCFTSGNIECKGKNNAKSRVGGIAGTTNNGYIYNCYNLANINGSGDILTCVGGILGAGSNINVENCYNAGKLFVNGNGIDGLSQIGGIVANLTNGIINNCYNCNILELAGSALGCFAGGILGIGQTTNINNSHNKGQIISNANSTESYIGLIIGRNNTGVVIQNCYYLKFENYTSSGYRSKNVNSIDVDKENDMPKILDTIGEKFKNGTSQYPILNWQ